MLDMQLTWLDSISVGRGKAISNPQIWKRQIHKLVSELQLAVQHTFANSLRYSIIQAISSQLYFQYLFVERVKCVLRYF